jgi:hypothetical protein
MHSRQEHAAFVLILCALYLCFGPEPARAQKTGFGFRAGASVDPGQFVFGGHLQTDPIIPSSHSVRTSSWVWAARSQPWRSMRNLPIGSCCRGSHSTSMSARDLPYSFSAPIEAAGVETTPPASKAASISSSASSTKGLFGEIKLGVIDSPAFKITMGYSFR